MPIYEYRCEACGHEFDELQKFAAAALTDCPSCGKPALIKKVSAAGFQLKGSGWYATDFKSKKKDAPTEAKPEAKSESKSDAKAEFKTETKVESKPEKKPESKPDPKPAKKPDAS